jgi:hypothetical protein
MPAGHTSVTTTPQSWISNCCGLPSISPEASADRGGREQHGQQRAGHLDLDQA